MEVKARRFGCILVFEGGKIFRLGGELAENAYNKAYAAGLRLIVRSYFQLLRMCMTFCPA